jgi:hypothetical protein
MTAPLITHIVISAHEVVSIGDEATLREDHHASLTLRQTEIVDLATADVAALARIAAVDYPALLRKGEGFLGAGTHVAQPYLEVMLHMTGITTEVIPGHTFGHDRVADIINAFLGNARAWQGETARAVKAALKAMAVKR